MRRVALLEQDERFGGAVVEWATGVMESLRRPSSGPRLKGREALEKAWRQIGKRRLHELGEVLTAAPNLTKRPDGWWTIQYDDVEASVYIGSDDRIALIRVDD
jgi:hypothetical protein